MSYQVLARKWRPRNFDELVGQEHVVRALRNALDNDRVHHAFLFTGTRGVGKTTLARILAKSLNCERGMSSAPCGECGTCQEVDQGRFVDLIEVDAASRAKVDQTRDLMDNVQFAPSRGRHKVYLIDEVHMFSAASFNALLKTLEEPPPHVKFLLATTDPQKVPVTVLSRCLQFNLKRLPVRSIAGHLDAILAREGIEGEAGATSLVARAADGSMRDALSLLDQAIAYGGGHLIVDDVRAMLGAVDRQHVLHLLKALAEADGRALLQALQILQGDGVDPDDTLEELARVLQRIAILQAVPDCASQDDELDVVASQFSGRVPPADVQLYYQIAILGRRDLSLAPDPFAGLEMTLLRMLAFQPGAAGASGSGRGGMPGGVPGPGGGGDPVDDALSPAFASAADGPSPAERARRAAGLERGSPGDATEPQTPVSSRPVPSAGSCAEAPPGGIPPEAEARPTTQPEAVIGVAVKQSKGSHEPELGGSEEIRYATQTSATESSGDEPIVRRVMPWPKPDSWAAWVTDVGLSGLVGELLAHTALISSEADTLKLRLAPEQAPLANARLRAELATELTQRLAKSVRVEVQVAAVDAETAAQRRARLLAERQAEAVAAISEDPGVQAICEAFDARVDPALVEPLD